MKKDLRESIKEMYISGAEISDICSIFGITRGNFYYHKKADFKKGIDWEEELLLVQRDKGSIKEKEALFLNTLIKSFEEYIQKSKNDEFSLKSKLVNNLKECIELIAKIALEEDNKIVCEFLSKNADKIINRVLKDKK